MNSDPALEPLRFSPLYQAKFKLEWADNQFSMASKIFAEYLNGIREHVFEYNENGRHLLVFEPALLPKELPVLVGSGIHALRSSLDTTVSILIQGITGKNEFVNFPIHEEEATFRDSFSRKQKKCLNCDHTHEIRAYNYKIMRSLPELQDILLNQIKPWKAANFELWALNRLDNFQKHTGLLQVMTRNIVDIDLHTREGINMRSCKFITRPGYRMMIVESSAPISIWMNAYECQISLPEKLPFDDVDLFQALSFLYKSTRNTILFLQECFQNHQALHL